MEDANFDRSVANQAVTYLHNEEEWARQVLAENAAGEGTDDCHFVPLLSLPLYLSSLDSPLFLTAFPPIHPQRLAGTLREGPFSFMDRVFDNEM
jgi:hypothetical protein